MADHSSELFALARESGSQTREFVASARASIQAAREAMAEADRIIAGEPPRPDGKSDRSRQAGDISAITLPG
jgi:hypothetical protein